MHLDYGAFLDTYYAYDFNQPESKRSYTTQASKHNEPSINLAHLEMKLQSEKLRGRFALQAGDAVEINAAAERGFPKYIQESYLGGNLGDKSWIDAGIFLGHIGAESWISKDNWTYTRSLPSEYTPYYAAGIRYTKEINSGESFQFQLINGWQNISENNEAKAIGMQYKRNLSQTVSLTYNNFFGDEEVTSSKPRFRGYHDFIFQWNKSNQWQYLFSIDLGHEAQQNNDGVDAWFNTMMTARRVLSERQSLAFRGEYYNDGHQVNVPTGTPNGFQVISASVNFDQKLTEYALWRTELRGYQSKDEIYPKGSTDQSKNDGFLVTSISLSF